MSIGLVAKSQLVQYDTYDHFEQEVLSDLDPEIGYVINFWATWCKPCVKELPYFEKLNNSGMQGVEIILVSLDFKKQISKKLIPFLEDRNMKSNVVALTDGKYNDWIDLIDPNWSGSIPATLFVKGDRKYFVEKEYHSSEEIYRDLQKLN